jgi:hypothetical protein
MKLDKIVRIAKLLENALINEGEMREELYTNYRHENCLLIWFIRFQYKIRHRSSGV